MSDFETGAWAQMLIETVERHRDGDGVEARRVPVTSYAEVDDVVRSWPWFSTAAVLLDEGRGLRAGTVRDFDGKQPWPPPEDVLGALDGSWVVEHDHVVALHAAAATSADARQDGTLLGVRKQSDPETRRETDLEIDR